MKKLLTLLTIAAALVFASSASAAVTTVIPNIGTFYFDPLGSKTITFDVPADTSVTPQPENSILPPVTSGNKIVSLDHYVVTENVNFLIGGDIARDDVFDGWYERRVAYDPFVATHFKNMLDMTVMEPHSCQAVGDLDTTNTPPLCNDFISPPMNLAVYAGHSYNVQASIFICGSWDDAVIQGSDGQLHNMGKNWACTYVPNAISPTTKSFSMLRPLSTGTLQGTEVNFKTKIRLHRAKRLHRPSFMHLLRP